MRIPTLIILITASFAQAAIPQLKLEVVCDRQIHSPVEMKPCGDTSGRSFIVDQRGKIYIFKDGMLRPGLFLDIGSKLVPERASFDERGLLGLAFHPGYSDSGSPGFRRFYVFYSAPSPNAPGSTTIPGVVTNPVDCRSVIAEYQVSATDPDRANPASERVLLSFDKPQFNHNGGGIEFGADGLLYVSVGDGGSSNDNNFGHTGGGAIPPATQRPTNAKGNAQDLTNLLGKLLRIDPLGTNGPGGQYGIPASNPFATSPNGERPEIYAFGLRNMWRFTFDGTRLIGADVGQGQVEEINLVTNGGNYGWRNKEGSFFPSFSIGAPAMSVPATDPIAQYAHPNVVIGSPPLPQWGLSITGGLVYRGSAIPALTGKYIFADWSGSFSTANGRMLGMEELTPGVFTLSQLDILGGNPLKYFIQGFGRDQAGELYVLAKTAAGVSAPDPATGLPAGVILKIVPVPATTAVTLTATKDNSIFSEGELSNGLDVSIFSGTTGESANGASRRALLAWNLATVPAGSTVASAEVALTMTKAPAAAKPDPLSLHRLTANWGEGTSNALGAGGDGAPAEGADVTWTKPFFNQAGLWTEPGGDFAPAPSATIMVNAETSVTGGIYRWSSPQLATDANGWLANAATNFGWLLKVDVEGFGRPATGASGASSITVADVEGITANMTVYGTGIGSGARVASVDDATGVVTLTIPNSSAVIGTAYFEVYTAKRFASRQTTATGPRPKLNLTYVPPPPAPSHRRAWELASYFTGQYIDDNYDTDGDGIVDGVEYAWGFQPRTANSMSAGFSVNYSALASTNLVVITFRRDPLATDLTYRAQVSTDLVNWTTLATSTAGGVPTGTGYVSEVVTDTPFRNVTVHDAVPPNGTLRFYRLQVLR